DEPPLDDYQLQPVVDQVYQALTVAGSSCRLDFGDEAKEFWREIYPKLSAERIGLLGALLARGEAQTRRLSLAYAALDKSSCIGLIHLQAARALWQYSEASCGYLQCWVR